MNTKAIVIIAILSFAMLTSVVYAFVQQTLAKEAQKQAVEQKMLAEAARAEAERQRIEAEMQRVVAEDTMGKLQTALQELELLKKRCR
jgi:type II secretory pathway pseudopilin PulG